MSRLIWGKRLCLANIWICLKNNMYQPAVMNAMALEDLRYNETKFGQPAILEDRFDPSSNPAVVFSAERSISGAVHLAYSPFCLCCTDVNHAPALLFPQPLFRQ